MERDRSFSSGWNSTRPRPPRIATVKPVSQSFSEDDLMKITDGKQNVSPRVFSRLNVQDLSILKKDNLIGELEKCLEELEDEHVTTNHLAEVYENVENERNQLLDELDVAFQDLQEYVQKQRVMEEQANDIENEREELVRENEYLKAVLSNRTEIRDNKIEEENRTLNERVKELEEKNTQLLDEINDLYEDRQTLISSLLNLRSEEVDDVIKRRSRNSSVASRDSSGDTERLRVLSEGFDDQVKELEDVFQQNTEIHESCKKVVNEMNAERHELQEAFKRVKKERDETERELDRLREDKENLEKKYTDKIKECDLLIEERNESNLNLSKLKLEKRTLQRQLDHMRETNRACATKSASLKEENDDLNASLSVLAARLAEDDIDNEKFENLKEELENSKKELEAALSDKDEVDSHVRQLEQSKLEEIESTKTDLEIEKSLSFELEKQQLSNEVTALKESIDLLDKNKTDSEKQVVNMNKKHKEIVKERDTLRNSYKQVCDKSSDLEAENVRFKREAMKLGNDNTLMNKQMKNRINTLEIEVTKLTSSKDAIEKILRRKEEDEKELNKEIEELEKRLQEKSNELRNGHSLSNANSEVLGAVNRKFNAVKDENEKMLQRNKLFEKTTKENKTEIKHLQDSKEVLLQRNRSLESEATNFTNNLNSMKIENDRITKKSRQYEKSANENITLQGEIKQLKDANEVLLKRYRVLENESNTISNKFDNLTLENDRITQKSKQFETLSSDNTTLRSEVKQLKDSIDILQKNIRTFESESNTNKSKTKEDEREKYSMLLVKYDNICKQYESINTQLKITHSSLEEKCEKLKIFLKENVRLRNELNVKSGDNGPSMQSQLEDKLRNLSKELDTLKENKQKMARDVQYILQSRREEAETVFTNKKNQIEHERDTIKAKYELLRVDCDKMNKEKDHYLMTIDTLREENGKLHDQVRKQRLISSSTQDLMLQRLRDDNDMLDRQLEVVKKSLNKSIAENKTLSDRIGRTDEGTVTTIRSLKARKNELQLKVNTLTHENEYYKKKLDARKEDSKNNENRCDTPDVKRKFAELELSQADLHDKLDNAQSKISELEMDNRDYGKKFQESESLMYDLQQALAQANDLAMQKSLEGTKTRRNLEKKADRLVLENTELKRKVYFTGKSDGEISPTSLFPRSPSSSFRNNEDPFKKNRKVSLPASILTDSTGSGRSTRLNSLKGSSQSFEYPILDPTLESQLLPRMSAASRQVELDISQQLKELLDLTNDLTTVKEDDQKSHDSQESLAPPPIPPPPANYDTLGTLRKKLKEKSDTDSDSSDKKNEDWV